MLQKLPEQITRASSSPTPKFNPGENSIFWALLQPKTRLAKPNSNSLVPRVKISPICLGKCLSKCSGKSLRISDVYRQS
jgi:hypothetical protein